MDDTRVTLSARIKKPKWTELVKSKPLHQLLRKLVSRVSLSLALVSTSIFGGVFLFRFSYSSKVSDRLIRNDPVLNGGRAKRIASRPYSETPAKTHTHTDKRKTNWREESEPFFVVVVVVVVQRGQLHQCSTTNKQPLNPLGGWWHFSSPTLLEDRSD